MGGGDVEGVEGERKEGGPGQLVMVYTIGRQPGVPLARD